ncbi:hypothetical protein AGLY_005658 [Aphis glycines]|uniref:Uncharacterized protein n=1 Tax=Aphis glycines TaxID=307491 RepID=A0A6G0TTD7_APHGL|nr:hypothetical protein AGLY_005658 [Aphis glycines]
MIIFQLNGMSVYSIIHESSKNSSFLALKQKIKELRFLFKFYRHKTDINSELNTIYNYSGNSDFRYVFHDDSHSHTFITARIDAYEKTIQYLQYLSLVLLNGPDISIQYGILNTSYKYSEYIFEIYIQNTFKKLPTVLLATSGLLELINCKLKIKQCITPNYILSCRRPYVHHIIAKTIIDIVCLTRYSLIALLVIIIVSSSMHKKINVLNARLYWSIDTDVHIVFNY